MFSVCFFDRINSTLQNNEVLSEQTCDLVWDRCHREIVKGETKHFIVLLSVPIAYPRVVCVSFKLPSAVSNIP